MSATFCFHISTSKITLNPLLFCLEHDGLKWTLESQLHIQSSYLCSNFHYIISFFSHKEKRTKKNLCHNPVRISNSFKNPKTFKSLLQTPISLQTSHPCYKSSSHYKKVILVTNPHLTTSPLRVRLVWSPWSKGYIIIHTCHISFNITKFHIFSLFVFHDIIIYLMCSWDSTLQI